MTDILKKGIYLISDPCYYYPKDKWSDFCDDLNGNNWHEFEGITFPVLDTAFGDGRYPVLKNKEIIGDFCVDAGLFALMPEKLLELWGADFDECRRLGTFIEVKEDTEFSCYGGNLKIGEYEALTDWDEEEIEEDESNID